MLAVKDKGERWFNGKCLNLPCALEYGSAEFHEFLRLIGEVIPLEGWNRFRGGLDASSNTTGTEAVFTSLHNDAFEVMFHVSTLLPFSPNNAQQLPRKRHIGNDVVVVIFQDELCEPFSAESFASHFNRTPMARRLVALAALRVLLLVACGGNKFN